MITISEFILVFYIMVVMLQLIDQLTIYSHQSKISASKNIDL